jgi:hypothetical protein
VGFGEVNAGNNRDTGKGGRASFAGQGQLRWEAKFSGQPPSGSNPTHWIETKDGLTFDQRAAREKRDPYGRTPPKLTTAAEPKVASPTTPPAGPKYTEKCVPRRRPLVKCLLGPQPTASPFPCLKTALAPLSLSDSLSLSLSDSLSLSLPGTPT